MSEFCSKTFFEMDMAKNALSLVFTIKCHDEILLVRRA